jgi:hypothetical protein
MKEGDIPMNNYIWDRHHLYDFKWHGKDNEYCVHGHTPVCHMSYFFPRINEAKVPLDKIFKYCEGHKIDIDLGSVVTHTACLLNLDTWEVIYFKDRTIKEENE